MKKFAIILVTFVLFFLVNTGSVFAIAVTVGCNPNESSSIDATKRCDDGLYCKVTDSNSPTVGTCQAAQIQVDKPQRGFATLGNAISNILTLAFAVAVLLVLVMLILGAYEWIASGGDKEAVGKARNRIINALVGLLILAIAFALVKVVGQFVGLDFQNLSIPGPNPNASGF